jgi:hypothetical protein
VVVRVVNVAGEVVGDAFEKEAVATARVAAEAVLVEVRRLMEENVARLVRCASVKVGAGVSFLREAAQKRGVEAIVQKAVFKHGTAGGEDNGLPMGFGGGRTPLERADVVRPGEFKEVEGVADILLVHVGEDGVVAAHRPAESGIWPDMVTRIG